MNFRYPVVLDLEDQPCLVVGDSWAAEGKVLGLLEANARVTLLSASASVALAVLADEERIRWLRRDYEPGDLAGYLLVTAATGDRTLTAPIAAEARERHVLFNAVDDPEHCTFAFPAVHRQGDLVLAVSSNGKSPAVAVRLRDRFVRELGPEYSFFLDLLGSLRGPLASLFPDFEQRKRIWYRLADSEALDLIRRGDAEAARRLLEQIVEEEHART